MWEPPVCADLATAQIWGTFLLSLRRGFPVRFPLQAGEEAAFPSGVLLGLLRDA